MTTRPGPAPPAAITTNEGRSDLSLKLAQLRRYQSLDLDAKIRYAMRLIETGLQLATRPIVAWSGGNDSTVLLHLVRTYHPNIDVSYCNTGVEFPETLKFVRRMKEEWALNLHIAKPRPDRNFWWCLENRGYPLLGKMFTRRNAEQFRSEKQRKILNAGVRLSPSCCWYCKEKPATDLHKNLHTDLLFLGTMAEESRRRRFNWCDYGDLRWNKHEQIWKLHPLSIWLEEDIWEYHRRFNIPICDLYAMGHRRNGCWPCGMDIAHPDNHLATLRRTHPKLWRFLMIDKGLGEELVKIKLALNDGQMSLFFANRSIEELLEQRPCFFDRL